MTKARQLAAISGLVILPVLFTFQLFSLSVSSEDLTPRWIGDQLQVSAPKLHFLTGKALQRLRNGAAVPFDFQLTVAASSDRNIALERALERFVVSYDLWEEKFTVVRLRNSRKSGSHLSAAAAESWCLENIGIQSAGIATDRSLWVKLEIRSAESKPAIALQDDGGISLATLIDVFSRPTRSQQDHWMSETGPFKLADLRAHKE